MAGKKQGIDKMQRMAAGHACMAMFGICNTLAHSVRMIAMHYPPSGVGFGDGLTEKERAFVQKLAGEIYENGEVLRKLGWRFRGVKT